MTFENSQTKASVEDRLNSARQMSSGGNLGPGQGDPLLANLWTQLDQIQPTIPDRLSIAILEGVGVQFDQSDVRLARLVSLAGQKFLTDVIADAMGHWRISNGLSSGLLNGTSHTNTGSANATTSSGTVGGTPGSATPSTPQSGASPLPNTPGRTPAQNPGSRHTPPDRRATLTLDDLIASLADRGIHVARPPYYR